MNNIIKIQLNKNNIEDNVQDINIKDINIKDVINYTWQDLKLDFQHILNEVYECLFILDDNNPTDKHNIIQNIYKQAELRNIIIDGLILNDLEYSKKFFDINLQDKIQENFHKFNSHLNLNIYQIKNKQVCKLYPYI